MRIISIVIILLTAVVGGCASPPWVKKAEVGRKAESAAREAAGIRESERQKAETTVGEAADTIKVAEAREAERRWTLAERAKLRALILSGEPISAPAAQDIAGASRNYSETNIDGAAMKCSSTRHSRTERFDSLAAFDPHADALWPGAMLQGKTLPAGHLTPISLPRTNGVITLAFDPTAGVTGEPGSLSRTIATMSHAAVQDAMHSLLAAHGNRVLPAKMSFSLQKFSSLEEAMLKVGASASYLGASARAQLSDLSLDRREKMVVAFTQAFFTITYASPPVPEAAFPDNTRTEDAALFMGKDNPPTYIASVTWGRTLLFFASSASSASDLEAALKASFDYASGKADVAWGERNRKVLERTDIRMLAHGGNPTDVVKVITGSITGDKREDLKSVISDGATFSAKSPGAPISYQVRYLKDNIPARLSFTVDYDEVGCLAPPYLKPVRATVSGLEFDDMADDDEDLTLGIGVLLLRQDGSVASAVESGSVEFDAEETSKTGGQWVDNVNRFFRGWTTASNDVITKIILRVAVNTRDGDGFNWGGMKEEQLNAPFPDEYQMVGGGQGRWRFKVKIENRP